MPQHYTYTSWAIGVEAKDSEGRFFTGFSARRKIKTDDDLIYTVKGQDTLSGIAYKFYGDPRLWWVIALANDAYNPSALIYAGRQLIIPSPDYVKKVILMS